MKKTGSLALTAFIVILIVQDIHELTQYLKSRFGKEKIYLLGHSWGSQKGMVAAHRYPEDYTAYIGVAQIANHDQSDVIAHEELERRIKEKENMKTLKNFRSSAVPLTKTMASMWRLPN